TFAPLASSNFISSRRFKRRVFNSNRFFARVNKEVGVRLGHAAQGVAIPSPRRPSTLVPSLSATSAHCDRCQSTLRNARTKNAARRSADLRIGGLRKGDGDHSSEVPRRTSSRANQVRSEFPKVLPKLGPGRRRGPFVPRALVIRASAT